MSAGVPMENILATIKRFVAVEHRIEYVAVKRGVVYYNDSKATNNSTIRSAASEPKRNTQPLPDTFHRTFSYNHSHGDRSCRSTMRVCTSLGI